MREYKGFYIPSIQEIQKAQERISEAREAGTTVWMNYEPYTGKFHAEITEKGQNPTYKYLHFVTYIPPWKNPHEIRQEIINYIEQKVT